MDDYSNLNNIKQLLERANTMSVMERIFVWKQYRLLSYDACKEVFYLERLSRKIDVNDANLMIFKAKCEQLTEELNKSKGKIELLESQLNKKNKT